jgi:hypothetical protein
MVGGEVCSTGIAGCLWPGMMGGIRGTTGLGLPQVPIEFWGADAREAAEAFYWHCMSTETGAKHRSGAGRVQDKCMWRCAAHNAVRSATACKGSTHGHKDRESVTLLVIMFQVGSCPFLQKSEDHVSDCLT